MTRQPPLWIPVARDMIVSAAASFAPRRAMLLAPQEEERLLLLAMVVERRERLRPEARIPRGPWLRHSLHGPIYVIRGTTFVSRSGSLAGLSARPPRSGPLCLE